MTHEGAPQHHDLLSQDPGQPQQEAVFNALDDEQLTATYGVDPDQIVSWGSHSGTWRTLITGAADEAGRKCPINIGETLRAAHEKDPKSGVQDTIQSMTMLGAQIGESSSVVQPPHADPSKKNF